MKRENSLKAGSLRAGVVLGCVALLVCGGALRAGADVVEMQNGDRYVGSVVSLSADKLVLQGQVLGLLELPRNQVAVIGLGAQAVTNLSRVHAPAKPQPQISALSSTNSGSDYSKLLRQLKLSTNLVQQVQRQFLSDAGPEAMDKFNELLSGLGAGSLNLDDIRAQARTAADQIRSMKKDLGENAGWTLDAYLGILDHFLKETTPAKGATTNAPAASKLKAAKPEADE